MVLDATTLENPLREPQKNSLKFLLKSDCLPLTHTKLQIPRPLVVMKKISTPLIISLCCSAPLVAENYDAQKLNRLGNTRNYETKPKFSQMIQALRRQAHVEIGEDELEKPWAPLEDPIAPAPVKVKEISPVTPEAGPAQISTPDLTAEEEAIGVDLYREPITRKEAFQPAEPLPDRVKATDTKLKEEKKTAEKSNGNSFFDRLKFFSKKEEPKPVKKAVSKEAQKEKSSGPDLLSVFKKLKFSSDSNESQASEQKASSSEQHYGVIKNFTLGDSAEPNSRKQLQVDTPNAQSEQNQDRTAYLKFEVEKREKANSEKKIKREAEMKAKQEAELKAKQGAEMKAKQDAEMKAKQDAEMKAKQEAELKAKQEAELKAKQDAEMKAKLEAEAQAKLEADHMAQLEAQKQAGIEADKNAKKPMLPANPEYIRRYKTHQENQSKNHTPEQSRREKKENQDNITSPIQKIIY